MVIRRVILKTRGIREIRGTRKLRTLRMVRNRPPPIAQLLTMGYTAAVVIPHQSGKRKRTPDSTGNMDESATEADNFVTSTVLPWIQSRSHRVNDRQHRMTPSADSLPVPRLSPEFLDPPSPHSFASDSGQDVKHQKPMSSRKAKALQMAKAEVCRFVGSTWRTKVTCTGDRGLNIHWVHGENIESAVNM